jgi:hypothetical protein
MTLFLRAALLLVGLLFFAIGTGFLIAPVRLGEAIGIAAEGTQGLASMRADFTAFFWVGGGAAALGGLRGDAGLLRVAAALVGIALAARVISLLVDGTYPAAFQPMVIEAVTLALALAGVRHFSKNG